MATASAISRRYLKAGNCVFCGAPIYEVRGVVYSAGGTALQDAEEAPTAHYTCTCRRKHGLVEGSDAEVPVKSVREGDEQFVDADMRRRYRPGETTDG